MQKPASILVHLVVVLVLVLMNSTAEVASGDQHEQVCIPPGANHEFSVAYNLASLPVEKPSDVQDLVLEGTNSALTNGFTKGFPDYCSGLDTYFVVPGQNIDLFSYAYCSQDVLGQQGCIDCLNRGERVIKQNCPNSCYGAQASSKNCCIRFEGANFCQVTVKQN
ncbi:hypothetical protein LINGRAHAP2_LOCUS12159 [Linum grandiflorum]